MSNRQTTFLLKKSGVAGKIPTQLQLGEIAINFADAKLYTSGTTAGSILPIGWDRVSRTGDTMTGTLYTPAISATTYYNLPNTTFTGGTVTGATRFTNGLTANTFSATSINKVDYIVFNTGTTSAATVAGTVYFDNTEKALSYNTSINQGVTVNLGQQQYLRVFNNSGTAIPRGKALEILSAYSGLPSVTLAVNKNTGFEIVGVSAEVIPNNSEGIIITSGIISNIPLTGISVGSLVYASDSVPGQLDDATKYFSFPLTARTNSVGYVIQTGATTGKLFVDIRNENKVLAFTDLERDIIEGNIASTGVFTFSGITLATSTTFNVGAAQGWIVDNTTDPLYPDAKYIGYSGQTGLTTPYLLTATSTYILLNSGGTLTLTNTFPTPQQRRQNIYLGKLGHGNKTTLLNVFNEADFDISPISQLRDMFTPIKLINLGIVTSPNGANLSFNNSAGTIWGLGIGFTTNQLNPNSFNISGSTPVTFQYRTQTGGTATNTTTVIPGSYDLNGLITAIGAPAKQATNQRIFLLQNGIFRIQYGQTIYADLTTAITASQTEIFNTFENFIDNGILVGILSLRSDTTNLSDPLYAKFLFTSKFGEVLGGTGGLSTTTLQQAYNNSPQPEILTNSTLNAFSIQNGSGSADTVSNLFEGYNTAGGITSFIRADGYISGVTFQTQGAFINNNGVTATTVSATTIKTPGFTANSNGITANTISATSITANNISGTTNYVSKFTGSNSLGNSLIYDNGTYVGIGTTSPSTKLDVIGTITAQALNLSAASTSYITATPSTGNSNIIIKSQGSTLTLSTTANSYADIRQSYLVQHLRIGAAAGNYGGNMYSYVGNSSNGFYWNTIDTPGVEATKMLLTTGGNLLVGTTGDTGFRLQVSGNTIIHGNLNVTGNTQSLFSGNSSVELVKIIQNGSGDAFVVEDIANGDASHFVINGSGNTAIGLTQPLGNDKLTVSGDTSIYGLLKATAISATSITATTGLFSASTQNVLKVIGSGNSTTLPIFSVQGSQGELFSITDSLTGSLFSVNDISGLPILEAFSDNTVLMGNYLAPSLNTTARVTAGTGLTNIYSIPTSAYTGAFFDYTISDNTNLRAGNVMAIWNSGTTVQYSETSTNDIGNTSGLTFNVIISGSSAILRTSGVTGNWTVKAIVRSI